MSVISLKYTSTLIAPIRWRGWKTGVSDDYFAGSRVIIGHNRYSTAGKKRSAINCVQPFVVYTAIGTVAIAHNGELVDAKQKREEVRGVKRRERESFRSQCRVLKVLHEGVGLSTDTDSELIAQMVAKAIALNYKCRSNSDWGDISKVSTISTTHKRNAAFLVYSLLFLLVIDCHAQPLFVFDSEK